jgi:hypothetical protein
MSGTVSPFSVAASSAALLGLTIQVQSLIYRARSSAAGPFSGHQNMMYELEKLRQSLKTLEQTCVNSPVRNITDARIIEGLMASFRECQSTLLVLFKSILDSLSTDVAAKDAILQGIHTALGVALHFESAESEHPWAFSDIEALSTMKSLEKVRVSLVNFTASRHL